MGQISEKFFYSGEKIVSVDLSGNLLTSSSLPADSLEFAESVSNIRIGLAFNQLNQGVPIEALGCKFIVNVIYAHAEQKF